LAEYTEQENHSHTSGDGADVTADIVLCAAAQTEGPDATESAGPASTPVPVPVSDTGSVIITVQDASIQTGDTGFTLLDGVTAKDEAGEDRFVWVVNDGGFRADVPGAYTVTYAAMQDDEMVLASRTVTVKGDASEGAEESRPAAGAPSGSSNSRYRKLLAYRNEIYDKLAPKMQALESELDATIEELISGKTNVRLMAETPLLEDDSGTDGQDAREIVPAAFSEVQEFTVSNWSDILAVFIAKGSLDLEDPLDLMELRNIPLDGLDEVFRDMVKISVLQTDDGTDVLLYTRSYKDMADEYHLSEKRTDLLYELMQPEFQSVFASLTGNTAFDDLTGSQIQAALSRLPEGLSIEREKVVSAANSLVGKVTYFWGGKYNALGWNPGWGLPRVVTSGGSRTTGTTRAYGLDCSGFVSWVFINATGDTSVLYVIGNGSSNQWTNSASIGWDEGQPGDLAFFGAPGQKDVNHVGIIVAVEEDGRYLVAHCSSSKNGVVVTDAWNSGFRYLRRPILYKGDE
jgi:hypothetical protein